MADDLGAKGPDVHVSAREVLGFWFALTPEQHFAKSARLDTEIETRFRPLRDSVLKSGAAGWRDDPNTLLAAIILLDQFSRNIYRGQAEAFAADALACELTMEALAKHWDDRMSVEDRHFLYMPLMHAEDATLQALSLAKFGALRDANTLEFARAHKAVIDKYGRFPSRNAALGRESTSQEQEYLSQPGAGW